jgi:hypothetical protein
VSKLARKNLVVDPVSVRALAASFGTSESEAVRRAVDAALSASVLDRLEQRYRLIDPAAVRAYLERHPFLLPLIEDAHAAILTSFGTVQQVALAPIVDPEDGTEDLFALVYTTLSPVAAGQALAHFDEIWADQAPTQGRFHVDFEYDDVV